MTDLERELTYKLALMVDQNLHEEEGIFDTGCIRLHKEVLMKLCDLGVMVDAHPHRNDRDSPWRWFYAKFVPDWERKLYDPSPTEGLHGH